MRIIIPIAGAISFEGPEYIFPKPLIDVDGKPLIEYVIENLSQIGSDIKFTFILKESLCTKYNLDYTLALLTSSPDIIKLKNETRGATCSVLMAYDKINQDDEIVIVNSDQILLTDINTAISTFREGSVTGGLITFESVHPRWSFALTDNNGWVLQTAEKKPISRNAIAGFYYFKSFKDFVEGAFESVYNEEFVDDHLYISSVMNQLILQNKLVKAFQIKNDEYISFYSPQKLKEFERLVVEKKILL
jgi:dTDP-glucose pyrophosphorylase